MARRAISAVLGIERVAQAVADEIQREQRGGEEEGRHINSQLA